MHAVPNTQGSKPHLDHWQQWCQSWSWQALQQTPTHMGTQAINIMHLIDPDCTWLVPAASLPIPLHYLMSPLAPAPGHSPFNYTIFLCTFLFLFILLFCLQANPMKQLSPVCLSISTIALQVSPPWMYKICKNLRFGGWTCWPLSTQFHNLPLHIPLPLHLIILCASQPHETTISSLSFYRHHCSASQPPMNVQNLQEFRVWGCTWSLSTQFHHLPLHIPLPLHLAILFASQPHETTISSLSFYKHHCSASQPPMNVQNL